MESRVFYIIFGLFVLIYINVFFYFFSFEFVVDEFVKGDWVVEGLEVRNWVVEDNYGSNDEENIFEDIGEGYDERGGFVNLWRKLVLVIFKFMIWM